MIEEREAQKIKIIHNNKTMPLDWFSRLVHFSAVHRKLSNSNYPMQRFTRTESSV